MNKPTSGLTPADRVRFTAAEFQRMMEAGAFDNMWIELVEGELERMPPPGEEHSTRLLELIAALLQVLPRAVIKPEVAVDLGDDTVFGCDLAVRKDAVAGKGPMSPGDVALAVEIAVTTRVRDLEYKRERYATAGVPVYWVIDEAARAVHVFERPEAGDYRATSLVRFGEPLAVPGSEATITLE